MDLMKVSKVENFALTTDGACEADRPADQRTLTTRAFALEFRGSKLCYNCLDGQNDPLPMSQDRASGSPVQFEWEPLFGVLGHAVQGDGEEALRGHRRLHGNRMLFCLSPCRYCWHLFAAAALKKDRCLALRCRSNSRLSREGPGIAGGAATGAAQTSAKMVVVGFHFAHAHQLCVRSDQRCWWRACDTCRTKEDANACEGRRVPKGQKWLWCDPVTPDFDSPYQRSRHAMQPMTKP